MGVGRAARPGDLGYTGSLALRMPTVSSGSEPLLRASTVEQRTPIQIALVMRPDDTSDDVRGPEQRLGQSMPMVNLEACPFRQGKPSTLNRPDIPPIQLQLTGLHKEVTDAE